MRAIVVNLLAVLGMSLVIVLFEFGQLRPGYAFFGALAVLTLFTADKFLAYEGKSLAVAARSIFTDPLSHGSKAAFAVYMFCVVSAVLVMAGSFATA